MNRALMHKITFSHGGKEYDDKYPDGIPTSLDIKLKSGQTLSSGFVMYPTGHARNTTADLKKILQHKGYNMLGDLVFENKTFKEEYLSNLENMGSSPNVKGIYAFDESMKAHPCIDG